VKVIVIGAGPTGLTLGAMLARRGHQVIAVDRDRGPAADGSWRRIGVMQFAHAHGFRAQVPELLLAEWPEAHDAWLALGAEPIVLDLPGGGTVGGVRSRRITYERALRTAARRVVGLTLAAGTVSGLVERDDPESGVVVCGVVVDGETLTSDVVIDASGRVPLAAGRALLDRECGISYVGRTYRQHADADPGPLTSALSWGGNFDGYSAIVFRHEDRHLSAVIVRPTTDAALADLRHVGAFHAATQAIPGMRDWTQPERASPTSAVMLGGRPRNVYRTQLGRRGLVAVGDAVSTTTPTAGRGIALASMQIRALLDLHDAGADLRSIADPFGAWCDAQILPWVDEHIARDDEAVRRLRGEDLDLSQPLTTTAIVDAAQVEPRIRPHLDGYLSMTSLPASLAPAEPLARAVYETGWRPPLADGPKHDELVGLIHTHKTVSHRDSPDDWRRHDRRQQGHAHTRMMTSSPVAITGA
jgi:2-polyprenyl-6-methoxyphenol hydroxylase-like FAD-dependent oxidoreductase